MSANPFEVLRLDPRSSEEEIVKQAGRLRQRSADEANLDALRQAVQMLTSDAETRILHALLAHPRPGHAAPALDRFIAGNRRPPAASAQSLPIFDEAEFLRLLLAHAAEELKGGAATFEPCAGDEDAEEIRRQAAEALWTSLIFDSRA